jgi:hypothetical protein
VTRTIGDYELIDHGLEYSQYFQGCGVSLTRFEHCAMGCGDCPDEALCDALEMIAQNGFDVEGLEARILADCGDFGDSPSAREEDPSEDDELHYYLSIRWNEREQTMHVKLNKEQLETIFAEAKDQADYLIAIYRLVFPQWDAIEKIHGWPSVNDKTWKAICRMAMDADPRLCDAMPGGAWMNSGFSTSHGKDLPDWHVSMEGVRLEMKPTVAV